MNIKKYIKELKRRNVIKAAISFVVFSWVLIQAASILYPVIGWGPHAIRNTVIILIICFPFWLVFAYVFEWTSEGFKKTDEVAEDTSIAKATSKKLNGIIIAGLSLAVLLLVTDRIFNFTGASETSNSDKSIAVLAFADMSQDKDQEYFSDGISEEILNLLAKMPDLKVISRTSSFSYKGKELNIKKIGEELQVGHILEGSIRKSGNTFRITAQLIKVSDGAHLWSETYDRDISDIFKIQDEIASTVTKQLKVTLLGVTLKSKTVDTEAYNLYLQGKQLYQQSTSQSIKNSEVVLRQSIAIDSSYAPTWILLSKNIFYQTVRYAFHSLEEGLEKAEFYAQKAMDLDPENADAYAIMARIQASSWDFISANNNIEKALDLGTDNVDVIRLAAGNAADFGNIKTAISLTLKALQMDPLNYDSHYNLAYYYRNNNQYDVAATYCQTFLLHNPNASVARSFYATILLRTGNNEQALVEVEKEPEVLWRLYGKCIVIYALGKTEEANALLNHFIKDYGDVAWPNIASVYAFRGDKENAFKWLNFAYNNRDSSLLEILNYPEMENLWGDPRWNTFINKLGLPDDHGFHRD